MADQGKQRQGDAVGKQVDSGGCRGGCRGMQGVQGGAAKQTAAKPAAAKAAAAKADDGRQRHTMPI